MLSPSVFNAYCAELPRRAVLASPGHRVPARAITNVHEDEVDPVYCGVCGDGIPFAGNMIVLCDGKGCQVGHGARYLTVAGTMRCRTIRTPY